MEKREKVVYEKRSQRDYSMSFKLEVVKEIESGLISTSGAKRKYGIQARSTVINWLRKYGTFDWENQTPSNMPQSKEQRLMELEARVKLLEKQKAMLEHLSEPVFTLADFSQGEVDEAMQVQESLREVLERRPLLQVLQQG